MSLSKLSVLVGASLGLYSFIHQPAPTSTYSSEVFTKVDTLNRPDENRFTKTVYLMTSTSLWNWQLRPMVVCFL
jgi:hypothetical protein